MESAADAGIYSECAVPIATNDSVLGVLDLQSRAVFNDEDMRDAATMAGQLAVAIENTRLFKAEQQRSARLALIARTGQRIATRLDPKICSIPWCKSFNKNWATTMPRCLCGMRMSQTYWCSSCINMAMACRKFCMMTCNC